MKKSIYILLNFILVISFKVSSNDSIYSTNKKIQFFIQTGLHYKFFIFERYIKPTPYKTGNFVDHDLEFKKHQYEGFYKVSSPGYNIGTIFSYCINRRLKFTSGIIFYLRKDIFERDIDTVLKYRNETQYRHYKNIVKYHYTFNNIELPLIFEYAIKKLTFSICNYFPVLSYKKAHYTYITYPDRNNPLFTWIISEKIIKEFELPLRLFSGIEVSYQVKVKNIKFTPYVASFYGIRNKNGIFFQCGVNMVFKGIKIT